MYRKLSMVQTLCVSSSWRGVISCNTEGVIYLITCPCGKAYVGKTSRELKTRIAQHRSTIRCKYLNYPVAAHFIEGNRPISSLKYMEKVSLPRRCGNLDHLLRREHFHIHYLNTLTQNSLNVEYDLKCFLSQFCCIEQKRGSKYRSVRFAYDACMG